jgi:hypothetical protein
MLRRMQQQKRVAALVVAGLIATGLSLAAQGTDKFNVRLSWVPISGTERANVTGKGSATATLSGTRLTIAGSFEGLAAPATVARLHHGMAKGARGLAIADLTIDKAPAGKISGTATLTAEQIADLKAGKLYVQVHSAKGVEPDGANLWGWLLK